MRKYIFLILLTSFTVHSEIGLHFDITGTLINPDDYLLKDAIKNDKKGFHDAARSLYKRSAKFGNKKAKYLIAMRYFQNKDFANGYAWLRLIKGNFLDVKPFKSKIEPLLTESELQQSDETYQILKDEYSDNAAFARREKWEKSIKITGSHLKGIRAATSNVRIYYDDSGNSVTGNSLARDVYKFKYEYEYEEAETDIKMGEIITIDEDR